MADALKRTVTTRRHEYVLSSPTNYAEVDKAVTWALSDLGAAQGKEMPTADTAVLVEARDDEVVVFWTEQVRA